MSKYYDPKQLPKPDEFITFKLGEKNTGIKKYYKEKYINNEELRELAIEGLDKTIHFNIDSAIAFTYIKSLEERIDKAIEYLTDPTKEFSEDCYYKICETVEAEDLINILKGSETDENNS